MGVRRTVRPGWVRGESFGQAAEEGLRNRVGMGREHGCVRLGHLQARGEFHRANHPAA
ncbi:hypothetical protein FAIPA1_690002 [Frankia sp. AiPs1]